jgi:hypothetical protein
MKLKFLCIFECIFLQIVKGIQLQHELKEKPIFMEKVIKDKQTSVKTNIVRYVLTYL